MKDSTDVTVEFSVDAEDEEDLFVPAKVKGTDPRTDLAVIAVDLDDINEDVMKQLKIADKELRPLPYKIAIAVGRRFMLKKK